MLSPNEIKQMTDSQLNKLTKAELIEQLRHTAAEAAKRRRQKSHKKFDALKILQDQGPIAIPDIAEQMEINTKNVSSLLTYLRKDGHQIHTDQEGRKYLV